MKQHLRGAAGGLAVAALLALSACGTPTNASGPLETLAKLDTPNYVTVAPVTTPPTTTPAAGSAAATTTTGETVHTVAANESLGIIAAKYGIKVEDLVAYNKFPSAAQVIHPGEKIKIPAGAKTPGSASSSGAASSSGDSSSSTPTSTEPVGDGCTYKIVLNDNPSKVAKKFGISVEELKAANSAQVMNSFLVGAELTIPAPGKC